MNNYRLKIDTTMKRILHLVIFISINTTCTFATTCVYDPPKCNPSIAIEMDDGKSILLVQKWVQAPKANAFCNSSTQRGHYICRRPDCTSSPCLHGATCTETRSSYRCHCVHGTYGSNCQQASVTTPTSPGITLTNPSAEFSASTSTHLMTTSAPDVPTDVNTVGMTTCNPTDSSTCNPTDSSTSTPTDSSTSTPIESSTSTPTESSTSTPIESSTSTPTESSTSTPTESSTGSSTSTPTESSTSTPTESSTGSSTSTPTESSTGSSTSTPTESSTSTPTESSTSTPTESSTSTPTESSTGSSTSTPTESSISTPTDPSTGTPTDPSTGSPTDSSTAPPSYQGKQYGFTSSTFTPKTFEDSRAACLGLFGEGSGSNPGLIELTDDAEKAFIIDFVSKTDIPTESSLWIGCPKYLSDDPEHGFYCYNSNYRYSSKHNIDIGYWDWDTDEPKKNDRRCMVLNLASQKYKAEFCESAEAIPLCEWTPS